MSKATAGWRVGDTVELTGAPRILAERLPAPVWYILTTAPSAERAAIAWLERNGIDGAWTPFETRWRRLPRAARKRVPYRAPMAPRSVFVPFQRQPMWHVLFERAGGKLTGVIARDGVPLEVPESAIAQMAQVPERLAAIKKREEQRRRIRPGDRVRVTKGPLEGWMVDVSRIHAGIAYFVAPLLGEREVAIEMHGLEKQNSS